MTKRLFILPITLFLVAGTFVLSLPDSRLHVVFCDVGQGDAILIIHRSTQILVDGGDNQQVLSCLGRHVPFWDRQIEAVFLTHAESDHLTGLIDVFKRYAVLQFVAKDTPSDSAVYREFVAVRDKEKTGSYSPKIGDRLRVGPVNLAVFWPASDKVLGASTLNANLETLVMTVNFGNFDVLLTGDAPAEIEDRFLKELPEGVEVLKVGHHGSKTSTSNELLKKLKPALAVISVGKNNRYHHPSPEVINRLQEFGIPILRTDTDGEIEVVSDGTRWYTRK